MSQVSQNYRPISLLPSISKIFENVMAAQLMDYFTTNNLFCIQQFGFRPGHSTELAALKLSNHLIAELDNCKIPTNIYIDLSKAFHTSNFNILLKKLEHYGINGSVELAKLSGWLGANKLALNISKTKYMLFHASKKISKSKNK